MIRSTGAQRCEILLHCGAGVVVASLVVRRRARARGVGSWQTAGAVDGRAGGRRLIALRLPLCLCDEVLFIIRVGEVSACVVNGHLEEGQDLAWVVLSC